MKARSSRAERQKQIALAYASRFGMQEEILRAINLGYSAEEALQEWDLFTNEVIEEMLKC